MGCIDHMKCQGFVVSVGEIADKQWLPDSLFLSKELPMVASLGNFSPNFIMNDVPI